MTQDDLKGTLFRFGLRSGSMVDTAKFNAITNWWEVWNPLDGFLMYEYETGLEQWNRRTYLLDANNTLVKFDRPIKFSYVHKTDYDRNAEATYDGQTFVLEYSGNGNLRGIPHQGDDQKERFYQTARKTPYFECGDESVPV